MKLQATELRIGNCILYKHDESVKVQMVLPDEIVEINRYNELPGLDEFARGFWYAPIPLTPPILFACGFIGKVEDLYYIKCGEGEYDTICIQMDSCWWWNVDATPDTPEEGSVWRKIEYLHELQNIYFVLAKKELPINIESLQSAIDEEEKGCPVCNEPPENCDGWHFGPKH